MSIALDVSGVSWYRQEVFMFCHGGLSMVLSCVTMTICLDYRYVVNFNSDTLSLTCGWLPLGSIIDTEGQRNKPYSNRKLCEPMLMYGF